MEEKKRELQNLNLDTESLKQEQLHTFGLFLLKRLSPYDTGAGFLQEARKFPTSIDTKE